MSGSAISRWTEAVSRWTRLLRSGPMSPPLPRTLWQDEQRASSEEKITSPRRGSPPSHCGAGPATVAAGRRDGRHDGPGGQKPVVRYGSLGRVGVRGVGGMEVEQERPPTPVLAMTVSGTHPPPVSSANSARPGTPVGGSVRVVRSPTRTSIGPSATMRKVTRPAGNRTRLRSVSVPGRSSAPASACARPSLPPGRRRPRGRVCGHQPVHDARSAASGFHAASTPLKL